MNKSESIVKLAEALALAQAEMPPVKFNSTNPFLKNKYADLGAIIETSQHVLAKFGLAVSQLVYSEGDQVGVETVLMHKSGEWLSTKVSMATMDEKGKSNAQVAGSIVTYLRRYSLAAILNMYADEDGDGNKVKLEKHDWQPIQAQNEPEIKAEAEAQAAGKPAVQAEVDPFDSTRNLDPKTLTLEQAKAVRSGTNGQSYGDLTLGELSGRFNSLTKAMKDKTSLSGDDIHDHEVRMSAIALLIKDKNGK